jgi:hypothetical protein
MGVKFLVFFLSTLVYQDTNESQALKSYMVQKAFPCVPTLVCVGDTNKQETNFLS